MRAIFYTIILSLAPASVAAQTPTPPAPAAKPAKPEKICRKLKNTGSRIAKRDCRTAEDWAARDATASAQDGADQARMAGAH